MHYRLLMPNSPDCLHRLETFSLVMSCHGLYCRSGWRERLPIPCDDWRVTTQRCGFPTDTVHHGHHTPHLDPPGQYFDEDLEPVYATISEITDSMDEASVLPAGNQLFIDLVQVFADLAALPSVDTGDGGSVPSSSASSPPPVLTDAPPAQRDTVPQPIPSQVVDRWPHSDNHRDTITSPPPRFYTYC